MYENKFLWGVDGVRDAGGRVDGDALLGGVLDRVGSCIVVTCPAWREAGSGDSGGGVG